MKNPWRESSKVNPQRENGHREINNECYHALMAARLPGAVYQIVLAVIDMTWGFTKHHAPISLGKFQEVTGLSRQSVCTAIREAEQLRLIVVSRDSTRTSSYMFNKHWDTWLTSKANHTSEGEELVKQITPNWSSKSHQSSQVNHPSTSQVATPRTEPVKKPLKKTIKKPLKKEDLLQNFKILWMAYPKKVAKADAEKAFAKINPDEQLLKIMLTSVERAKKSEDWLKDDGKFIPHPATWLNGRRWEDEFTEQADHKSKFGDGWK